jgi:hypothetical protein
MKVASPRYATTNRSNSLLACGTVVMMTSRQMSPAKSSPS